MTRDEAMASNPIYFGFAPTSSDLIPRADKSASARSPRCRCGALSVLNLNTARNPAVRSLVAGGF
jgi:hypothetical protein